MAIMKRIKDDLKLTERWNRTPEWNATLRNETRVVRTARLTWWSVAAIVATAPLLVGAQLPLALVAYGVGRYVAHQQGKTVDRIIEQRALAAATAGRGARRVENGDLGRERTLDLTDGQAGFDARPAASFGPRVEAPRPPAYQADTGASSLADTSVSGPATSGKSSARSSGGDFGR